ncbi:MAG: D-alanine--D-alanine ligase [Kangiellaceae bacterium]|jgi:D-alanine-D-alanine ligase|nr:D-alanine--D-alanine ligase [Kangiellaceae bacterium]
MTEHLFRKIAVAYGGSSAEREISLKSGRAVADSLTRQGYEVVLFDPSEQSMQFLLSQDVSHVWNALHGRGGEDGVMQAVLDFNQIKYTGSNVMSSALSMDKWRTKMIWKAMGLPVAAHRLVKHTHDLSEQYLRNIYGMLGPNIFVKPSHEGSSVGMSKVTKFDQLREAIELARESDNEVLVESFIEGKEYTVAILNGRALPSISMETPREFYDYQAKYQSTDTQYHCPSGLAETAELELGEIALAAFESVGCSGWGRVDFIRDKHNEQFKLLEVNTVPGMTETSLVPKAAKAMGISFDQLVIEILKTSES